MDASHLMMTVLLCEDYDITDMHGCARLFQQQQSDAEMMSATVSDGNS